MREISPIFYLLQPENLPISRDRLRCGDIVQEVLSHILNLTRNENTILDGIHQAFSLLAPSFEGISVVKEDPLESLENRANDEAFNIKRVNGNPSYVLTYSTLQSYAGMLEDALDIGTSLSEVEWTKLNLAYISIFDMLRGGITPINSFKFSTIMPKKSRTYNNENERDGMRRWVCGHYVFMSIVQAMIVALNFFSSEVANDDIQASQLAIDRAILLMKGSESALKFTGDFSRRSYEQSVRPSLSPPKAPRGMSGVNWRDHEYLIKKVFRKLQPIFLNPPLEVKAKLYDFLDALKDAYDAHKLVCSFFVGNDKPSLLSKKSAMNMLESYKQNRVAVLKKPQKGLRV
uniref:RenD n=1 Tax=Candidatus Endohaliclona renieramycinifaciens TaxID=2565582 RepID=A0A4D6G3H0_9GAMM|nr:RenD [Candidatus Endohaliclona renieramycinifaciens]QCC21395.1 RenD [Candidatus Endohaliclona renieramycinifaciens]QCC21411.1 RenD [Candidatus Endohaliclona renieramycinifaciens]QCC21427.1 RenD [Candidatus Endohaliclona renieramycinifaciens]